MIAKETRVHHSVACTRELLTRHDAQGSQV
jgi:hypothetical protein